MSVKREKLPQWARDFPLLEIEAAAKQYGLDFNLVLAICAQESNGNTWAIRYEPQVSDRYIIQYRDFASALMISEATEVVCQKTSWGILQVMGFLARELGHKSHLTQLTRLQVGLDYGCKHLANLKRRYTEESDVIASYNMGSPRKTSGGMYENQKHYVDPIHARLLQLRKLA